MKLGLAVKEKEHKPLVEKEAQKSQSNTSSMKTEKKNDRGKAVIEYPPQPQP